MAEERFRAFRLKLYSTMGQRFAAAEDLLDITLKSASSRS
jgi:hypothetical protein